jgi:hypothetical protein
VPDYQREYVWKDKEVIRLLDDINEQVAASTDKEYFIGTVLVSPTDQKEHFDVIDGQQRLTTLFLLLCALQVMLKDQEAAQPLSQLISLSYPTKDGEAKTSLKLEPRYEGAPAIISKIVETAGDPSETTAAINAMGVKDYGSLTNIVNAYTAIYVYLQNNYKTEQELKQYWGYLANNVIFFQIQTDVGSALKIFETINERGIGLNPMDLLKNLLFTNVSLTEFSQLKDTWKQITKPLEKAKEKPLRFLRYFLMANYKITNKRNDGIIREDEIYDWLVRSDNSELCNYKNAPFEFVNKIVRNVEIYLDVAACKDNEGNPSKSMESVRALAGGAFSLHNILLLACQPLPVHLYTHFVKQLEVFLFYYIFTKSPTKDLERNFSAWADELRTISALTDEEAQKVRLDEFLNERFQKSIDLKEAELSDALNRYTYNSMQKYRTKYLLSKLTQYVDGAFKGLKELPPLVDYQGLEIEHILPNNPQDELRASFESGSEEGVYDDYKIMLGNLTLLEKPINIVASNDFFEQKKPLYQTSKNYLTSSISSLAEVGKNSSITRINVKLESYPEWNASSIERRQAVLIDLASDIWQLRKFQN